MVANQRHTQSLSMALRNTQRLPLVRLEALTSLELVKPKRSVIQQLPMAD